MKILGIGLVVVVSLMLASLGRFKGCTWPKHVPISGIVTAKEWVPAHDDMWFLTMIVGDQTYMIPQTDHIPDRWWIKVAGRKLRVSKEEFQRIQIGDFFSEPPS